MKTITGLWQRSGHLSSDQFVISTFQRVWLSLFIFLFGKNQWMFSEPSVMSFLSKQEQASLRCDKMTRRAADGCAWRWGGDIWQRNCATKQQNTHVDTHLTRLDIGSRLTRNQSGNVSVLSGQLWTRRFFKLDFGFQDAAERWKIQGIWLGSEGLSSLGLDDRDAQKD